jgi:tight adherence protein B
MQSLALFFLVAVAIGGVAWVFIYPMLSGEKHAERRMETITKPGLVAAARTARNQTKSRREQVEGSLKDLEARQAKKRSVPLHVKIQQAGLTWSKRQFFLISAAMGVAAFLLFVMIDAGLPAAAAMAFGAGFGMPLWLLKFLKKRRETKFLDAFPDAVDTIVRGIKAGLPLLDSMRVIAADAFASIDMACIFPFIFLRSRSTRERLPSASDRLPPDFCWIEITMPKKLASGSGIRS